MSSNAFARSRPRVRHQRVPRTHGYVHPRFLQLVKELARIDEAKKKQEEPEPDDSCGTGEGGCSSGVGGNNCSAATSCGVSSSTSRTGDCSSTTTTITSDHQHNQPSSTNNSDCCPSAQNLTSCSSSGATSSCCGATNGAQASNGYRSLGCNQSTSATNDNYYRQNNNNHQLNNYEQNYTSHNHHHHQHNNNHPQHPRDSNHHHHHHHLSNSNLHHQAHLHQPQQHQEDRCLAAKSTSSSSSSSSSSSASSLASTTNVNSTTTTTTTTTNLGYLKQGLLEQNNSDFSNINLDLRQDENRSKRKRSSNDPSSSSKKLSASSSSSSSCGTLSKRHKSSPEPIRPLSPSFTKCPICLLDCMDRDPSFTNTCFHLFCFVCIENWTKNKATCPLCRTKFTKIIYNIRSASCYDEKVASPIRRDDDDERVIIYEQLQGLNTNQMVPNRGSNVDETRPSFDQLRVNDVLMPPFTLYNQIDHRQDSLRSFSTTTTTANFNSSVPHHPLFNYNPTASNYILIPSVGLSPRVQQQLANTHDALSSAYAVNSGLATGGPDPGRSSRVPRNGRYIYPRNYDLQTIDNPGRVSRTSGGGGSSGSGTGAGGSSAMNSAGGGGGLPLDRQIHHSQHPHPNNHHHHSQHGVHGQHRSTTTTTTTLDLGARQSQRMDHSHIHMAHSNLPRYYNPSVYSRRPYTNPPIDQHILDNLYRQMPDI